MKRAAAAIALALVVTGCSTEPNSAEAAAATPPATADATQPAPTAAPDASSSAGGCASADLSMSKSEVVATVNGEPVRASDLGEDAAKAEADARRAYCTEIDRIRRMAVDRTIEQRLLEAEARKAGQDLDTFVRARVSEAVPQPTDAEIEAYYDEFKADGAPPLDQVRPQVAQEIMREASEKAFAALVAGVRGEAQIEVRLPDVRPEAMEVDIPQHTAAFGPETAAVEIVEFSDFECPYCQKAALAVNEVKKQYGDRVRFAYRHFPLSFHPNAMKAAQVAQCAQEQDKFWPLHDALFASPGALGDGGVERAASEAGLDDAALSTCLSSSRPDEQIQADMAKARELGVEGTPTFFVNGRLFTGRPTPEGFAEAIDAELARKG